MAAASAAGQPSMSAVANLRFVRDLLRVACVLPIAGAALATAKENVLATVAGASNAPSPEEHQVLAVEILGALLPCPGLLSPEEKHAALSQLQDNLVAPEEAPLALATASLGALVACSARDAQAVLDSAVVGALLEAGTAMSLHAAAQLCQQGVILDVVAPELVKMMEG